MEYTAWFKRTERKQDLTASNYNIKRRPESLQHQHYLHYSVLF